MAHGAGPYMDSFKWKLGVMKHAADRLSSLKDANGEPLMNSAVLFNATEYSDFGNHSLFGRSVFTIGSARGALKTGYHVHGGGAPVQRAHITVMKAMGLTQAEIELGGKAGFGEHMSYGNDSYSEGGPDGSFSTADAAKYGSDVEKRKTLAGLLP
jgi:hypothetical protein